MKEHGKKLLSAGKEKLQQRKFSLVTAAVGVVFVLFVVVGSYIMFRGAVQVLGALGGGITDGIVQVFGEQVKTDAQGRTNILVIGVGGGDHEGPNLTDSMMVASINHKQKSAALLSIPRDLYVTVPKIGGTKINGVFDAALKRELAGYNTNEPISAADEESAMGELKSVVEDVTGVDIQYYVKIDFHGFVEMVDLVGGVEVNVPENFIDREYPDDSYGYTTFYLKKGLQTLDGDTALKYARSRHSSSDYDRSARQQVILKALLEKITSKGVLTDPSKLRRMYLSISSSISTDMSWREIVTMAGFAKDLSPDSIASAGLHDDPTRIGGLLYTPNREYFGGASVSLPNGATAANTNYYTDIQFFANMYFTHPEFFSNPPKVLILNGTRINGSRVGGVATEARALFKKFTDATVDVANAPDEMDTKETLAYYTSDVAKNDLEVTSIFLPATEHKLSRISSGIEEEIATDLQEYDIVIVLGNDYKEYLSR